MVGASKQLTWGKVVAVGQKARDFPFRYAEGDTVLIPYSGGFHARMASTKYGDSKEYYIVKADDIMGTLPSK
ncbi:hypothetical protein HHK36_006785 [Tetracentron sinense]|uniref:Uncharacterized protein n=1 Tax=Tetracentron sinense TaxID=13715 RepID=A0A834ZJM0_TETSI|nr:hypothetical protein HHK36_006785 [Tetracentron sinense]